MTLQSQAPRAQHTWRASRPVSPLSRFGFGPRLIAALGIAIIAGLVVAAWMRSSATPAAAGSMNAEDLASKSTTGTTDPLVYSAKPGSAPIKVDTKPEPEPVVIRMDASRTSATSSTTALTQSNPAPISAQPATPTITQSPAPAPGFSNVPAGIIDPTTARQTPSAAVTPVASNAIAGGTPETRQLLTEAAQAQAAGRLVDARTKFNKALFDATLSPSERGMIRAQMTMLNQTLVFSSTVAPGDALFDSYIVKGGDNPTLIVRRQGLPVDRLFIQRINGLGDGKGLRVGQRVKVTRTPFHAVVSKSAHRLDLYMGTPITGAASDGRAVGPDMQEADWTYIRSFRVGLGESNGTPEGLFVIKANSKLINPTWKNPRTGEFFAADDPKNPIGEHWMGLEGVDENTRKFTGYGIHGTVDPASIGQNMSMGCVRLAADDVAMLYEVLMDKITTVKIVP